MYNLIFRRKSHKLEMEENDCFGKMNMKTVGIFMLFNIVDIRYVRVDHGYSTTLVVGKAWGRTTSREKLMG